MTAYTNAHVRCDGKVPSDLTKSGTIGCPAVVKGGEQAGGEWVFPRTQAEARKLAKSLGWAFVRHPGRGMRSLDRDLCPQHKAQED